MYKIPGCIIKDKLFESPNTLIYRGLRQVDDSPIVLKILKEDYPLPEELVRYRQEYEITRGLDLPGVIRTFGQEKYGNTLAIILEDFGGESLRILQNKQSFTVEESLRVIIRIASILGELHQLHVIHKDVNPSNIVYNPETDVLKLIDFGISTKLSREMPVLGNPEGLEGTLAYMSPEQTGRMNRALDYRTDFYALGATLYELLTGRPPFPVQDPVELVHCHLAREPVSPGELNSQVSDNLSQVTLKLLAKRAEDRYQTTQGLAADLGFCLEQLEGAKGQVPFTPGARDVSAVFQLPQKLYGREGELETLVAGAQRAFQGRSEALFVAGYSGVGKSALIKELYRTLITPDSGSGYFISGKFEQYHRNIPYSAARAAFRDLIRQLLTESERRLARWKINIAQALGPNGGIITDFLPELKLIIGEQPPVPELDAEANRNRFTLELRKFVNLFLRSEHPLVLFLDDLQWADLASLELIKLMTVDTRHLFLIGAYRDNEVGPGHPLLLTLDEMRNANTPLRSIGLNPLSIRDVRDYIAEATRRNPDETGELADLVKQKTAGNPFFMGEFLNSMERQNLLTFDESGWFWDMGAVQEQNITDNVVELMTERVRGLDSDTKSAFMSAACLGNTFELSTLALVHGKSSADTAGDLWPALEQNLLQPLRGAYKIAALAPLDLPVHEGQVRVVYKFAHDRTLEAGYNLIPKQDREALHLKVGRLLLAGTSEEASTETIFSIVDHLNLGRELMEDPVERRQAARLNLQAGSRAQASTAYGAALSYYKIGLELLGGLESSPWVREYELTLSLTGQAAEAAMLALDFVEMDRLLEDGLGRATNILDQAKLYEIRILAFSSRNELAAAVDTALFILKKLGVSLPKRAGKLHALIGLIRTKIRLGRKTPEDILALPRMQDPWARAASRMLEMAGFAVYSSAPELAPLMAFEKIRLSLKYGNAPETPGSYNLYGMLLAGVLKDPVNGYKYGELALDMVEHLNASQVRAKVIFTFNYLIRHWTRPEQEPIEALLEAYKIALETGDLNFAALSLHVAGGFAYFAGNDLGEQDKALNIRAGIITELKQNAALNYLNQVLGLVRRLRGIGEFPIPLVGEAKDAATQSAIYCWDFMGSFILQAPLEDTLSLANETEKYIRGAVGSMAIPVFYFFDCLTRLATLPGLDISERKPVLKKVRSNLKKIKTWADYSPMNHLHRYYLILAEEARVLGQDEKARKLYDKSIQQARLSDHLNDEALAWELAGRFYLAEGPDYSARFFLQNAHYAYSRWGAGAKVTQLEETYPEVFGSDNTVGASPGEHSLRIGGSHSISGISTGMASGALDLSTIIKASQAISSEIVLDSLLHNIMRLLIENAGAQKGFFLLKKADGLVLEAREEVTPQGGFYSDDVESRDADWTGQDELIFDESQLPLSLLDYTMRTEEVLVLTNAHEQGEFTGSEYIRKKLVRSVLCVPMRKQGRVIGLVYMENNLMPGAFTAGHVEVVKILSAQIELSIENARLYANLEDKVEERTRQLKSALNDVQSLKNRQDGDYFLTSILLKPLCENTATDSIIQSDILIKQHKQFQFQRWTAEIGGDICACHDLTLRGHTYTLFLNADAMGKSMQGAGGSLVLLAALKAMLGKVNTSPTLQDQSPESWLVNAFQELHSIFATFDGGMQISLIMGLAEGRNKRIYYLNAEHPRPVLYRQGRAEYFGPDSTTPKLGALSVDPAVGIEFLELQSGDMVLLGSDGKDDLDLGPGPGGEREILDDDSVFLDCVQEGLGEPEQIQAGLLKRGEFIDDFSLLRLRVTW